MQVNHPGLDVVAAGSGGQVVACSEAGSAAGSAAGRPRRVSSSEEEEDQDDGEEDEEEDKEEDEEEEEKGEVQREGVAGDSRDGQHPHSPVQHAQQMEDDKKEEKGVGNNSHNRDPCVAATHDQNATVHALDASQQQLQEHTVIDEQPRNVVDELGAGSNQYTGKYLPAWLHEDKEIKAWEKDVLASHIISLDICVQPSVEMRCHPYKSHRPIKNTSKKI
eukprot:g77982.t1